MVHNDGVGRVVHIYRRLLHRTGGSVRATHSRVLDPIPIRMRTCVVTELLAFHAQSPEQRLLPFFR
jgi:hypothetical protein